MNRHDRRTIQAKARKTQKGLDQLGRAAQKLKGLEALPDALKDVQAILEGVNEARIALSLAIQDIGDLGRKYDRLEHVVKALSMASGHGEFIARIEAEYDADHAEDQGVPTVQEAAPAEPVPET